MYLFSIDHFIGQFILNKNSFLFISLKLNLPQFHFSLGWDSSYWRHRVLCYWREAADASGEDKEVCVMLRFHNSRTCCQNLLQPNPAHLTLKGSHNVHAAGTTVCHPVLWLTAFQIAEGTTEAAPDCVMKLWNSLNNSGYSWGTACGSKNTTTPLWPVNFNILNPPSFLTFHADSSLPTLTPCTILLKSTKTSVSLCLLNAQSFKV